MIVGSAAEIGRGAGEQLGLGRHLGVDLHADDDLPVAGGAGDEVLRIGRSGFDEVEISDDLVEPARQAALRASRAGDAVSVHTALSEALVLQKEAHMKTEVLLAELAEWDNFQSILSLTRDILNRQKSLTERARHYAREN